MAHSHNFWRLLKTWKVVFFLIRCAGTFKVKMSLKRGGLKKKKTSTEWLLIIIGQCTDKFNDCLPNNLEVLNVFCYQHVILNKPISESAIVVTSTLLDIWKRAHIPTTAFRNITRKLKTMYNSYQQLKQK